MSVFERPADDRQDAMLAAYELSGRDSDAGATCPLLQGRVQLLPLRYGLVEELTPGIATPYTLSAKPLGIRLLRNGYLYVLDGKTNELAEYTFHDHGHVVNGGKLDYHTDRTLYICFSEVQWTAAKRAQVQESEEDRDVLMQAVNLTGANPMTGGGEHLITPAQAEKWVAEFAEDAQPEMPDNGHEQEGEAYHWESDHYYHKTRLGKLLVQHEVDDRDECLCVIVRDDIGVMRDLAQFQDNVVEWLDEWATENEGRIERDYALGCYIESMTQLTAATMQSLAPGEEGSPEQALWHALEALEDTDRERTRQALLDYLNEEEQPLSGPASYAQIPPLREMERRNDARQRLRQGDADYIEQHLDTLLAIKKTNNRRVRDQLEGASWGQRGINDFIKRDEMASFLAQQRPLLARWNDLLARISQDRAKMLCSNYFHLSAWYFDADDDAQVEAAFATEYACTRDICRDDQVVEQIQHWLTQYPHYDRPLLHTRRLQEQAALIKEYTVLFAAGYGVITHVQHWVETLAHAERGKLPEVATLPESVQALAYSVQANLSPALGMGMARMMERLAQATGEMGVTLPELDDLFRQLEPPAVWARIVDAARINHAQFVVSAASLEELMARVNSTLRLRQQLTSVNNRRQQASGRERTQLAAQRRDLQRRLITHEHALAAALSPVGEAGANDLMLSEGRAGRAGLVLAFEDSAHAVAVGRVTSNLRQGIYRAPPAALLGDGVGLLVAVGQAINLWAATKAWIEARRGRDGNEIKQTRTDLFGAIAATAAAGFMAAQSIGNTALGARAQTLASALRASQANGVYAQLGKLHFVLGGVGYLAGFFAAAFSLNNNHHHWQDAVRRGNAHAQGAAVMAMTGDTGLIGSYTYGLKATLATRASIARGAMTWSMAGPYLASVFWRVNAIGLVFSILQLAGTWLYNRSNLSQHDQWLLTSPWGREGGNERLEYYLQALQRISQAAHVTLEEVYTESWLPNKLRTPDHYLIKLQLPGLAPGALHPPLAGKAAVRVSVKAWQVQPTKLRPRDGAILAAQRWLDASTALAQALAVSSDTETGHLVLAGSTPPHRTTDSGYPTEHWVIGIQWEQRDEDGDYQANEAFIYIDPRGGVGSGKRYLPSSFPLRGAPARWQLIEA